MNNPGYAINPVLSHFFLFDIIKQKCC